MTGQLPVMEFFGPQKLGQGSKFKKSDLEIIKKTAWEYFE